MANIFWRVRFDNGAKALDTEEGYLVLDPSLNAVGVYDDNGKKIKVVIGYTTTDSGDDPVEGVTPPVWAGTI